MSSFVAFGSRWINLVKHSRSSFYSCCFYLCAGEDVPPLSSGDADERVVSGRSRPMRDGFLTRTRRHRSSDGA
jgi:hypothetical protein